MIYNKLDKEKITKGYNNFITISIGRFYCKKVSKVAGINELIGNKLANIYGICTPECNLIFIDNEYYILSSDLNQYGKFKTAMDLNIRNNNLYSIWQGLNLKLGNIKDLMQDVIKMYIFDILFMNSDRGQENWGVLINNSHKKLCIYDHGLLFDNDTMPIITSNYSHKNMNTNYKEILCFLKESSSEYGFLLQKMIEMVDENLLINIFQEIESENNIIINNKDELIIKFNSNRELLISTMKGLDNGRR